MKNKGFTIVELLAVIVILGIVSVIVVYTARHVIGSGKNGVYQNHENTLKGAAQNYLIKNSNLLPNVGSSITITYNDLKDNNFLSELKDPNGGICSSSQVTISREADNGLNYTLNYKVCLICSQYKSDNC